MSPLPPHSHEGEGKGREGKGKDCNSKRERGSHRQGIRVHMGKGRHHIDFNSKMGVCVHGSLLVCVCAFVFPARPPQTVAGCFGATAADEACCLEQCSASP